MVVQVNISATIRTEGLNSPTCTPYPRSQRPINAMTGIAEGIANNTGSDEDTSLLGTPWQTPLCTGVSADLSGVGLVACAASAVVRWRRWSWVDGVRNHNAGCGDVTLRVCQRQRVAGFALDWSGLTLLERVGGHKGDEERKDDFELHVDG